MCYEKVLTRLILVVSLPILTSGNITVKVAELVLTKAGPSFYKELNASNTKLISASENYSRRDIGQNLLFILLFGSELRFGICKICNANPSFSICMRNRHVWNLAASLMCCPMVIYDSTPLSAPSDVYAVAFVFVF